MKIFPGNNKPELPGDQAYTDTDKIMSEIRLATREISLKNGAVFDKKQTDYLRGMPARVSEDTGEILYFVNGDESVYRISLSDLAKTITETRNSPEIASLFEASGIEPENLDSFFDTIGTDTYVVHRRLNGEGWIRHLIQKVTPEGVVYMPNLNLELNPAVMIEDPATWLKQLTNEEVDSPTIFGFEPRREYPRKTSQDSYAEPNENIDILRFEDQGEIDQSLYLVMKDLP